MINQPTLIKGLDVLRFFSAFSIILYHLTLGFQDSFYPAIKMFLHNLPFGVDCFFLISGFLITYLLLVEKASTGKISLPKFYMRRALRIFPLYYLVIGIAYWYYHSTNPEIEFTKFACFWGNFSMIETDKWTVSMLNPLWSLCIEEHFYLVIPVILWFTPKEKVKYLFIGIILLSLLFRIYASIYCQWMTFYCHTMSRCDVLALGGLIACYYHQNNKAFDEINSKHIFISLLYLVLLMCILDASDYTLVVFALFKKYLFVLPMLIIFLGFSLSNAAENAVLQYLREHRILNYLGKISFGLYMYHSPVAEFLQRFDVIKNHRSLMLLGVIGATILVSIISYELFEKQILKLKGRFAAV